MKKKKDKQPKKYQKKLSLYHLTFEQVVDLAMKKKGLELIGPVKLGERIKPKVAGGHQSRRRLTFRTHPMYFPRHLSKIEVLGEACLQWARVFKMKRSLSAIIVLLLSMCAVSSAFAQQPTPPPPPERAVITFIVPIDSNSVNYLIAIVNNQVRMGVKKITLVISSPGGDTAAAFAAYNILKNEPVEITTFNSGNIDSAAMLLYLSGKYRYSFASPARFLIHSNFLTMTGGSSVPLDYNFLESELQQLKSLNSEIAKAIAENSNKKQPELEEMMKNQTILTPEQAKDWGLVQEIRTTFMEPGAVFVSVNQPVGPSEKPVEIKDPSPAISSGTKP